MEGEYTIRAFLRQITGDMPAIDKIINAKGHNGRTPDRCRKFQGAQFDNNKYYFPPRHPITKATLFNIRGNQARRTPTSLATDVRAVEEARAGPSLQSTVEEMEKDCGFKGYSLLCSPSPAHKSLYPHLKYLEKLGSNVAPYDVMHLLFCNVVPFLWDLFSGAWRVSGTGQDDFLMSAADSDAAGRELRAARPMVPRLQARSLRDVKTHHKSYKAEDWMYFILSTGEAVLSGRIPDIYFEMYMSLCYACRLLIRPGGLSRAELLVADNHLKNVCEVFYEHVYRNDYNRLPVCRFPISALLNIVPNIRACGPVWVSWQFPAERLIGSLPDLIGSRSEPHPSLTNAIHAKYKAELVTTFGETFCPAEWSDATGLPLGGADTGRRGTLSFPPGADEQVYLLPPRTRPFELCGAELDHLRAALILEQVMDLPNQIMAIKFFRLKLTNGVVAGSAATKTARTRRNNLLRIAAVDERENRAGVRQEYPIDVYGLALFYIVVVIRNQPMAFAYIECIKSAADRDGKWGIPEKWRRMDCFTALGGRRKFVPLMAVDAVVGTLQRDGRERILFCRSPFSIV